MIICLILLLIWVVLSTINVLILLPLFEKKNILITTSDNYAFGLILSPLAFIIFLLMFLVYYFNNFSKMIKSFSENLWGM